MTTPKCEFKCMLQGITKKQPENMRDPRAHAGRIISILGDIFISFHRRDQETLQEHHESSMHVCCRVRSGHPRAQAYYAQY